MAGYDGWSKSWNAVDAEERGLVTASTVAKALRVPSGWVSEGFSFQVQP